MRFLIDANLPRSVIAAVRRVGHEAEFARDIGLGAAPDEKIAAYARKNQFEITEPTREAVGAWISHAGLSPQSSLFPSRLHGSTPLSTRQYARIVDAWVRQLGLDNASYGTHTLRRTKATLIYRRTKNLRPARDIQDTECPEKS